MLWALTDHLGSVRDVVDSDGTPRIHRAFNEFGEFGRTHYDGSGTEVTEGQAGFVDVAFAYTGRWLDRDTGLQNNLHRWYDAGTGRWTSEDPIGFAAGDANLNRYVGNKPTTHVDPDGLEAELPGNTTTDEMTWWEYLFTGRVRSKPRDENSLGRLDNNRRGAWGAEAEQNTCESFRQAREMAAERLKSTGTDVAIEISTAGAGGLVVWLRRGRHAAVPIDLVGQLGLHIDDQRKLLRIAMNSVKSGKVAHHLIPLEAITKYRTLMEKGARDGININGCNNGILLREGIDHIGNHSNYNTAVIRELGNIPENWSPERVAARLQEIAEILRKAIKYSDFGPWG